MTSSTVVEVCTTAAEVSLAPAACCVVEARISAALEARTPANYSFGYSNGGPIEAERLDALPYATLCLADARRLARPR